MSSNDMSQIDRSNNEYTIYARNDSIGFVFITL